MENKNLEKKGKLSIGKILLLIFAVIIILVWMFFAVCWGMVIIFGDIKNGFIGGVLGLLGIYVWYSLFKKFKSNKK